MRSTDILILSDEVYEHMVYDGLRHESICRHPVLCVDYSAISAMSEADFVVWLTAEIGFAAIPVSAFYDSPRESGIVRFCFAKQDQTLQQALQCLAKI